VDADGKWRVLRLHVEDQIPLAALARDTGIGLRTLERWHHRYRNGGISALEQQPRTDSGHKRTKGALVAFVEHLAPGPDPASRLCTAWLSPKRNGRN